MSVKRSFYKRHREGAITARCDQIGSTVPFRLTYSYGWDLGWDLYSCVTKHI